VYDVITLDGYCASGKSTLAKEFSKYNDLYTLSTGDAHRINVYNILNLKIDYTNAVELKRYLEEIDLEYTIISNRVVCILNGITIDDIDRNSIITILPCITSIPIVCEKFTSYFRGIIADKTIVVDGHGVGSGIFPCAKLKFFCTASLSVRTQRRNAQNPKIDIAQTNKYIMDRDKSDKERKINPLVITNDMKIINTEADSINICIDKMNDYYKKLLSN